MIKLSYRLIGNHNVCLNYIRYGRYFYYGTFVPLLNIMENKQKHLEFIQNVINRMSYNSFNLKRWAITVAVTLVLFIENTSADYTIIICIPIIVFWMLDGYFLSKERLFRALYNSVRKLDEEKIDFSMEIKRYTENKYNGLLYSLVSPVLLLFYGSLVIIVLLSICST